MRPFYTYSDDSRGVRDALAEAAAIIEHDGTADRVTNCDGCGRAFPDDAWGYGITWANDGEPGASLGLGVVCVTCRDRALRAAAE